MIDLPPVPSTETRVHDDVKACKNVTESYIKNTRMKPNVKIEVCLRHIEKMEKLASYCPSTDLINRPVLLECIVRLKKCISDTQLLEAEQERQAALALDQETNPEKQPVAVSTQQFQVLNQKVEKLERQVEQLLKIVQSLKN